MYSNISAMYFYVFIPQFSFMHITRVGRYYKVGRLDRAEMTCFLLHWIGMSYDVCKVRHCITAYCITNFILCFVFTNLKIPCILLFYYISYCIHSLNTIIYIYELRSATGGS